MVLAYLKQIRKVSGLYSVILLQDQEQVALVSLIPQQP